MRARGFARGFATASSLPLVFYVKRAHAVAFASVAVPAAADVAALVDAAIAKLRLDAPPDAVTLALEAGGPPLDARRSLTDAFDARALALRPALLATVHAPAAEEVAPPLPYRMADPDVECEPQPMASEADFMHFVRGRSLWAVTDKPSGGGQKRSMLTSLASARRALAAGAHLLLRELGDALEADVSNLKRTRKNADTSFAEHANKAAACDASLRARYGELAPLNNGEGVVFVDKTTGKDFASFDGLLVSTTALVLNESKARLCEDDVAVVRTAHARLAAIVEDPQRFSSRPADIPLILQSPVPRRTIVPLLSSTSCDGKTAAACRAARVHVLVRSGAGFECALAEGEFAAG